VSGKNGSHVLEGAVISRTAELPEVTGRQAVEFWRHKTSRRRRWREWWVDWMVIIFAMAGILIAMCAGILVVWVVVSAVQVSLP